MLTKEIPQPSSCYFEKKVIEKINKVTLFLCLIYPSPPFLNSLSTIKKQKKTKKNKKKQKKTKKNKKKQKKTKKKKQKKTKKKQKKQKKQKKTTKGKERFRTTRS